jgi:hypothetical protein
MKTIPARPKTPKQRLEWIARYGKSNLGEVTVLRHWTAIAVLAAILLVVGLAFWIGDGGAEIFRAQSQRLESLAAP